MAHFGALKEELKPFVAQLHETFGIDEARELVARASLKNFGEATFLVATPSITAEAQQALLKLFEEPQPGTTFVLLVPRGVILPTLLSRMAPYPHQGPTLMTHGGAKKFLSASHTERSEEIARILKDDEGVKERVREFLDSLERELHPRISEPVVREGLEDIAMVRDYLRDRSPSVKMLLEHLALCLPKN
jgi:hypothetical protein